LLQDKQLEKIPSHQRVEGIFSHRAIIVLNSIYEAQLSSDNCKQKLFSLYISRHRLLPYDCMSIAYFMSIAPVKCLVLHQCEFGDQGAEILARYKHHLSFLKVLDLKDNNITHKGMKSLTTIIKSNTNLTHFSVSHNPIFDDVIQLLKFKHLIHLNISNIQMTEHGAFALGKNFKLNDSLQSLKIQCNNIKDGGLTGILDNLPGTLVQLIVSICGLTYNGAVSIGKMLKINKTIKYLDIAINSIGDDGISAISDSLHVNKTLIQLVARYCEFNNEGAKSVAKMLQVNRTLKYLDITGNSIGDDGILAISDSLHVNKTLIQLVACYCEFNNEGAKSIAKMLQVNRTLKYLNISHNNFEEDGITAVINSIQANNTLIHLKSCSYLFCSKSIQSVIKLLMVNKTLKYLGITCDDNDNAGDEITSILETFLKNSCKLDTNHSMSEPCTCEVNLRKCKVFTAHHKSYSFQSLYRQCTLKVYTILTIQ